VGVRAVRQYKLQRAEHFVFKPSLENPDSVDMFVPWCKRADHPGRGVWVPIATTGRRWDPVIMVRDHIRRRRLAPRDCVWRWLDGRLVSKRSIVRAYQGHQLLIGEKEPWRTTGHSCRRGGASAARRAGMGKETIKMVGRWSGPDWKRYGWTS
jgi:hypothetical protein